MSMRTRPLRSVTGFKEYRLILFQEGEEKERIVGVVSREKASRTIEAYIDADLN
jgi:hypothetical protein